MIILLALILVPIVEIYMLLQVGHLIGVLPTIALLVADSFLGAWLVRREGARVWSAFTGALSQGRIPAREVADGALVLFGGALLLTPGFVSDVIGILCLLPPSRAVLRPLLLRYVGRRAAAGQAGSGPRWVRWVRSERADGPASARGNPVIEGELRGGPDGSG